MHNTMAATLDIGDALEEPPLVIDLDGTLVRTDLLIEAGLDFVHHQPHRLAASFQWLRNGVGALSQGLAQATALDATALPYKREVIDLIETERKRGRRVVLTTEYPLCLAEQVARHLRLFDQVITTQGSKRDALVKNFGEGGFDYVGHDDLRVSQSARRAYVVDPGAGMERRARKLGNLAAVFPSDGSAVRDWSRAMRLQQWLKNLLVFIPLLAAHRYGEIALVAQAAVAFLCFGLCASSVYILNDLLDLNDDRHHRTKCKRPFASGRLSIQSGLAVFPGLLVAAFALGLAVLPPAFSIGLLCYYALTLAYSLTLKRRMVIDVITLAALYTLRIVVGAVALGIALSFWILAFSMFMFLSLALVKRYAELFHIRAQGNTGKASGRGYYAADLGMIGPLGAASAYMAVMVMALYINDPHTAELYRRPEVIWLACPLLLTWISRVWMLAHRGEMNEDPVVFAVRDRISLGIGVLVAMVFLAAS